MKKQKRRVLSLLLAVLVTLTMIPASFAADDLDGHWSQDAMETWVDYGVIKGYEDGSVRPDKSITRGELAVMLDRIMSYQNKSSNNFNDLGDSWYTDAILGASAAGIIGGYEDGTVRPEATISRQEAVVMIARVLGLHVAGTADNMFTDANEIGSWAKDAVDAMAAAGYIHGSNGQFRPTAGITRAEIVTILNNIFAGLCREGGSYTEDVDGSLVVNSSDVSLEGMTIKGDLIIAEGVAANSVVLDGVTVEGRIIVRGGGTGSNAVVITGDSVVDTVVVQRQDEAVEIEVQGNAQVNEIVASSGTESVTVSGTVDTVTVDDANTTVEIAGTVNTLSVTENAANADVTVAKGATVDSVTTVAENTTLNVSGTIKDVTVSENANNATVSTETGAKVESVTTSGAGTTVSGSGTVSKVEAAEGSTGTTVETGGTTIENNSSESVTTDKGSVDAGETGTTSGGTTSGGGSSSGGSSSGGHSHNYVDGVCTANDGAYDPTWAQVNSVETWNAAVEAGKNIVVTGNFEANAQLLIAKVITVNGNGKTITSKNDAENAADSAGILVTAGAAIKNLTVSGPNYNTNGWDEGEYGIKVYNTNDVKLENVTVTAANAGIQVNSATVDLAGTITVSGNEFGGIEVCKSRNEVLSAGTLNIGSATIVCTDTAVPAIWIDGTGNTAGVVNGADKLFAYQPNGKNQIYYFTTLTEIGTATIPAGMTLTVDSLTVTGTLNVTGTLTVTGDLTVAEGGQITGNGTVTAPGYAKSGNNWVKLFSGGYGTVDSPYQLSTARDVDHIISSASNTYFYEMTNDIELTSQDVKRRTYGVQAFNGVLDGKGHTLSGLNQQKTYYFLIKNTYGDSKIQNLTVLYDSPEVGQNALLVEMVNGTFTFDHVTTTGVLTYNYEGRNEAPFLYSVNSGGTVNFTDCANYCNIYSAAGYNSAFVGYSAYQPNSTFNFTRCANHGEIRCKWASVFFGNNTQWQNTATVTLADCVNYGTVIGTEAAGLFTWKANNDTALTDAKYQEYTNQITNNGTCRVDKLDGLAVSVDQDTKEIKITREFGDVAVAYYTVAISGYTGAYSATGASIGSDMFAIEKRIEIGSNAKGTTFGTGVYRYDFRQLITDEVQTAATAANIPLTYGVSANNYTVVTSDYDSVNKADIITVAGQNYYLFKDPAFFGDSAGTNLGVSILEKQELTVNVYAYSSDGKLIGSAKA